MKKIITTIFATLFATATFAETLTVVNPGSEEGVFRQILTEIVGDQDHQFIQANNPVTAYTYFDSENILTVWSSEWPGNPKLPSPVINEDNLVALMTYETLICSRVFESLDAMSGKQVKIATWGSEPVAKFLATLGNTLNVEFVVVPFDGSGSMTKGYIAKDADTVFTIQSREATLKADTATQCIAFSANGDLGFRFVDAIITVNANDDIVTDLQNIINQEKETAEWKDKFSGSVTYVEGDLLPLFNEAVINFTK